MKTTYSYWYRKELLFAVFIVIENSNFQIRQPFYAIFFLTYTAPFANFYRPTLPKKCSCIFWQTQSLAKYCVKSGCPNTHILKTVCSVLSSQLFLVFGSNLAFVPKNKNQMHFSGLGDNVQYIWQFYRRGIYYEKEVFACAGAYTSA